MEKEELLVKARQFDMDSAAKKNIDLALRKLREFVNKPTFDQMNIDE